MAFNFPGTNQANSNMNKRWPEPTKSAAPPDEPAPSGRSSPTSTLPPPAARTGSQAVPVSFPQPYTASGGMTPFEDLGGLGQVNVVPSGFITPSSSGSWEVYDPMQGGALLRQIRPYSIEERRGLEAQAASLAVAAPNTVAALKALVDGRRDASIITKASVSARAQAAKIDLETGKAMATAATDMMELAPGWAELKAQMRQTLGESNHQQQISVAGVTGEIYQALGAG